MVDETDKTNSERSLTRRSVLAAGAAAMGGAAGLAGRASAQVTRTGLIPGPERWDDANLAGFMIHVGESPDPESPIQPRECDFGDWPPEETSRYDVTIINRKQDDAPEEETTLFVDAAVNMASGQLFLVNSFERCPSGYVGVELEQIGRSDVPGAEGGPVADIQEDQRPDTATTDETGAIGPGFGVPAALAGALGLGGWLANRRR